MDIEQKRNEIREIIAIHLYAKYYRAKHWEFVWDNEYDFVKEIFNDDANKLLKALNPLVVIPDTEATTPRELMAEKHYTGEADKIYRLAEEAMLKAGYIKTCKLVEE